MTDELHDHAANYSSLSYTKADWRTKMLQCLPADLPMYMKDRIKYYEEAGIPETVYRDLDAQVLHLALRARFPGSNTW